MVRPLFAPLVWSAVAASTIGCVAPTDDPVDEPAQVSEALSVPDYGRFLQRPIRWVATSAFPDPGWLEGGHVWHHYVDPEPPHARRGEYSPTGVCRAWFEGAQHAGYFFAGGATCHFGWGGVARTSSTFEILYPIRSKSIAWVRGTGSAPAGAVLAGTEHGEPRYVCRAASPKGMPAPFDPSGIYVGKTVGPSCNFAFAGREVIATDFEILTARSPFEL